MGTGSLSDLVDRLISSRHVYRIRRACSWFGREPDSAQIVLILAFCILAVILLVWLRQPKPVGQNSAVRIKPMVTPQEMRNVLLEAERSRHRR